MGYESKVFIGKRKDYGDWVYFDELATFDLSKMGYEEVYGKTFPALFDTKADFTVYSLGSDEDGYPTTDCYGADICYTSIECVLQWLYNANTTKEYWRAMVLYQFLLSLVFPLSGNAYENMIVVHYGY